MDCSRFKHIFFSITKDINSYKKEAYPYHGVHPYKIYIMEYIYIKGEWCFSPFILLRFYRRFNKTQTDDTITTQPGEPFDWVFESVVGILTDTPHNPCIGWPMLPR